MITQQTIREIYRKHRRKPADIYDLNLSPLFDDPAKPHNITIDDQTLIIGSVEPQSPLRHIPLANIHAILEIDKHIAIVLHSSIIFLQKDTPSVTVHLKPPTPL